ncbi:MAG: hypothetical protein HY363_04795 [Candidatus Aenigmarchaeota archaeon]|nr:hypothetical protein [Candidatus Aenigmarchaeota archaeon]
MTTYIDEYIRRGAKRLVKYGFVQKGKEHKYLDKEGTLIKPEKFDELLEAKKSEIEKKKEKWTEPNYEDDADMDWMEVQRDQLVSMPYPKPDSRYHIIYESFHEAIEPVYYWCFNHAVYDWGFPIVHKITDIFGASEHSTFYGGAAQRLGLAQDKVSAYLATIGKMTKDLFALVRELRILDERLGLYKDIFDLPEPKTEEEKKKNEQKRESAEVALKGLWVDMVDGVVQGQRTAANLFLMAQQLQFASLPQVFFNIHPKKKDEISENVEPKAYNRDLKTALIRKLEAYINWRDATNVELRNRKKYQIEYLRQHYEVIRMYIQWIKPYLKHIQRLTGAARFGDRAELVSSFEGSMIEIEFLAQKLPGPKAKDVYTCLLMTFEYRTKPQLSFQAEGGYHRAPIHVGETKITWRSYAWTQKQIENYIQLKADEDFELLAAIDESLRAAMDALGGDLQKYLKEEKEKLEPKEEKKPEQPSVWAPFIDIGKGFKELALPFIPKSQKPILSGPSDDEKKAASGSAKMHAWQHYKNFKKAHGMLAW